MPNGAITGLAVRFNALCMSDGGFNPRRRRHTPNLKYTRGSSKPVFHTVASPRSRLMPHPRRSCARCPWRPGLEAAAGCLRLCHLLHPFEHQLTHFEAQVQTGVHVALEVNAGPEPRVASFLRIPHERLSIGREKGREHLGDCT